MIDHNTVQKILDAAHIEEVVGDFVSLRRRGVNLIGLCPFHNEKSPSFSLPTKTPMPLSALKKRASRA